MVKETQQQEKLNSRSLEKTDRRSIMVNQRQMIEHSFT
jgi:hypothetical protein